MTVVGEWYLPFLILTLCFFFPALLRKGVTEQLWGHQVPSQGQTTTVWFPSQDYRGFMFNSYLSDFEFHGKNTENYLKSYGEAA